MNKCIVFNVSDQFAISNKSSLTDSLVTMALIVHSDEAELRMKLALPASGEAARIYTIYREKTKQMLLLRFCQEVVLILLLDKIIFPISYAFAILLLTP